MAITEGTLLIQQAMTYVIELYREMTQENGAPTLGTQNRVVDFILADPELCLAVSDWARAFEIEEAATNAPTCVPRDSSYRRLRTCLQCMMAPSAFSRPNKIPADRR